MITLDNLMFFMRHQTDEDHVDLIVWRWHLYLAKKEGTNE